MSDVEPPPATDPEGADAPPGSSRGWKIAAGISVVLAIAAVGVLGSLLLFSEEDTSGDVRACIIDRDFTKTEGGHAAGSECPPKGAKMTDGLVKKTTDGGFTIQAIRKGKLADTVELHVREPDRQYIDIAHAQTHAALGQPVRVYTQVIDGRESVVYMKDTPLLN